MDPKHPLMSGIEEKKMANDNGKEDKKWTTKEIVDTGASLLTAGGVTYLAVKSGSKGLRRGKARSLWSR